MLKSRNVNDVLKSYKTMKIMLKYVKLVNNVLYVDNANVRKNYLFKNMWQSKMYYVNFEDRTIDGTMS